MVNTDGTWGSTYNNATATEVIARLGADHIEAILAMEHPVSFAQCRATGWWDANEGDLFSVYTRLAQLLIAGEIKPALEAAKAHRLSWTCACAICTTARRTLGRLCA